MNDDAYKGVEALAEMLRNRDILISENDRMKTDLMLLRERNTQYKSTIDQLATERDHYMRYSTELSVKLGDIQMLIGTALEAAKHAAYKPSAVPVPTKLPEHEMLEKDATNLKGILHRLQAKGGEHDD